MRSSWSALKRANLYSSSQQVQHIFAGKRRKKRYYGKAKPKLTKQEKQQQKSIRKVVLEQRANKMRENMTGAEAFLAEVILFPEKMSGHVFKAQVPILYYIADFACANRRLVVEVDGMIHNTRREYDEKRGFNLMKAGWRTLRFTNQRVMADRQGVLNEIVAALRAKCPPTRNIIPNA